MKPFLLSSLCSIALMATSGLAQEFGPETDPGLGDDVDIDLPSTPPTDTPWKFTWTDEDYGFFSHGYLRFGAGDSDAGDFYVFQLNGALSKYRLGNESDVYGELGLGFRGDLGNGSDLVTEVMANGWGNSNAFNNGAPFDGGNGIVQAYAGVERVGDGALAEAFVWIGRRFYRRRDVYITDFYYENFSGDGIGIENANLGGLNLSTALFHNIDDDIDYTTTVLDVRLGDIPIGVFDGEIGAAYLDATGDAALGDRGYSLRFHLEGDELPWGQFRAAVMYGVGPALDFNSIGAPYAANDDTRARVVAQALIETSDTFQSQATAVWDQSDIGGETLTWYSIGIRPQYNITSNWGVAVELGYDQIESETMGDNSLAKLSLAPFYSFGRIGFFARPQLRAFATWASWNEPGAITEQAGYGTATDGMTYGLQLEQWW